jgi:hypothetical protein
MAEVTAAQLDQHEGRDRRRTVVIYRTAAAEAPTSNAADGSVPKEKLASHKNLMYSEREAELIEDLTRFLIEKQPSYVLMKAKNQLGLFASSLNCCYFVNYTACRKFTSTLMLYGSLYTYFQHIMTILLPSNSVVVKSVFVRSIPS